MEENGTFGLHRGLRRGRSSPSPVSFPKALILVTLDEVLAMNQQSPTTPHQIELTRHAVLPDGRRIAFIEAGWHSEIVANAREAFAETMIASGIAADDIEQLAVPGSLEIPLQAQLLAKTGRYAVIVAAGLIVDGGIYRHDFVARSVIDGLMRVQLDTEVPVLSVVLTPHHFHEHADHQRFFEDHFRIKGREAAEACVQTLANMAALAKAAQAA
jgi:6,7-dimethyl-8-ribityllumazine synthase